MQGVKTTIKRHFPGLVPFVRQLRSKTRRRVDTGANAKTMADVFTQVYKLNYWGNPELRSGPGSDLGQTAVIRAEIPNLIRDFGVKSMLDIPCGDFFWMRECATGVETYIGADIVPDMVRKLNRRFAASNRRFEVFNICEDTLPKVDLILCRDMLVHFSSRDIKRAIANLKRSGSTYLLATTFTNRDQNVDISTGDWRPLNLQIAPFSFPKPLGLINEACTQDRNRYMDKSLGLWQLADLR